MTMKRVDDFRLHLGKQELVPIMVGGMAWIFRPPISRSKSPPGGVGHISDAMLPTVADRRYDTDFVKEKLSSTNTISKTRQVCGEIRSRPGCRGDALAREPFHASQARFGMIFINCMEKLTMNAPRETLTVRLRAALDAGIDGITLAAGLHLGSFAMMEDHRASAMPSSASSSPACARCNCFCARTPEPTACRITSWWKAARGGHLGFGMDWKNTTCAP